MKGLQKLICGFLAFVMVFTILPIPAYAEEVCTEDAHVWDEGVRTEATENDPAFLTYTCTVCGQTKVEEEEPVVLEELPCEHSWDCGVSSETVITYTCKLCGETRTEDIPEEESIFCADDAHVWDDGVSSETVITYTCTICGKTKDEPVVNSDADEIIDETETYTLIYKDGLDGAWFEDQVFTGLKAGDPLPMVGFGGPEMETVNPGYVPVGFDPELPSSVTGSATYTVHWEPACTVTFSDGVGGALFNDQVYTGLWVGAPMPAFGFGGPEVGTVKPGYTPDGWEPELTEQVTGTVTYTVHWRELTEEELHAPITIVFTWKNGNSYEDISSQVLTSDNEFYSVPSMTAPEGKVFVGWKCSLPGWAPEVGSTYYYDKFVSLGLSGNTLIVCEAVFEDAADFISDIIIDENAFPDDNFRSYIQGFDTDGDGQLSESERVAVTNMSISYMGITSLAGIEYFPALTSLYCEGNALSSLDLSKNPVLTNVDCRYNRYEVNLRPDNTYDLKQLPGNFEVEKALEWSQGSVDGTILNANLTGTCRGEITYTYDVDGVGRKEEFTLVVYGSHTPGDQVLANYTECGGGWIADHYECSVCYAKCDEKGAELSWWDVYKEGNKQHTADLNKKQDADYTECGGGWIVDHYSCTNCNQSCLLDGSELDWEKYHKNGTGIHLPDTSDEWQPNYTECGGGWIVTRYPCKNCNRTCLLDGTEPDYETYYKDGNGHHTADLNMGYPPDYTECGGGWTVEYYSCEKCNRSCLIDGTELDHDVHYKEGTGKHTPGFKKEPTYTECGGGYTAPYHECVECGEMCDSDGNELDWGELYQQGNGKHTPGKIFEPNFTECGTGYKIPYSVCTICDRECRVDGSEIDYSTDYGHGNGKHTPGIIYKWDYRRCGVGDENASEYSICVVCGYRCYPDGTNMDWGEGLLSTHIDDDQNGICDKGGEIIYAVTGGNIYLDPATGFIRDCDSSVTEANVPSSIEGIHVNGIMRYAFAYDLPSKLQKITLPDGLQTIEAQAFASRYHLESLAIPNTVVSIGESAFAECASIPELVIPDSVKNIENMAFAWCMELANVTIGDGVERIGYNAFLKCHKLDTITFTGDAPVIEDTAFKSVTATVYYPGNNSTWTEAVRQNYGGTLTWVAYDTTNENTLVLDEAQFGSTSVIWIDGLQYIIKDSDRVDGKVYLELPDTERKILTTHTYNTGSSNLHQVYPTGMKVWKLSNDGTSYTATELKEFANILQYCGSSIRMTGKKGIRMITGVPDGQRNSLINGNLAGYTLEEYGTVIGFANEVGDNLTLANGRSNYAYKRGVSDAIFAQSGGKTQYTNVLVGFTMEQCKEDIAMRPYMKVKDSEGNVSVIYGGIVYRSIGYIAWQNRDVYPQGSDGYNYIWDIINATYGDNQPS